MLHSRTLLRNVTHSKIAEAIRQLRELVIVVEVLYPATVKLPNR
jgi:hypothetical protein